VVRPLCMGDNYHGHCEFHALILRSWKCEFCQTTLKTCLSKCPSCTDSQGPQLKNCKRIWALLFMYIYDWWLLAEIEGRPYTMVWVAPGHQDTFELLLALFPSRLDLLPDTLIWDMTALPKEMKESPRSCSDPPSWVSFALILSQPSDGPKAPESMSQEFHQGHGFSSSLPF
jgi:hypothetical protein